MYGDADGAIERLEVRAELHHPVYPRVSPSSVPTHFRVCALFRNLNLAEVTTGWQRLQAAKNLRFLGPIRSFHWKCDRSQSIGLVRSCYAFLYQSESSISLEAAIFHHSSRP